MNREAFIIYLQNLRDLEAAKWIIENKYHKKEREYQDKESEYQEKYSYYKTTAQYITAQHIDTDYISDESKDIYVFAFGCAVSASLFFFLGLLGVNHINTKSGIYFIICFVFGYGCYLISIVSVIRFIFAIFKAFLETKNDRVRKNNIKIINRKEDKRVKLYNDQQYEKYKNFPALRAQNEENWKKEKELLKNESEFLISEKKKVETLLKEAYSLNIIPLPYRNLSAIYYIYDYMSTSQQNFEQTLLHERMENGIQRLENKLDKIISQNTEIIFNTRRIGESTDRLSVQMSDMSYNMKQISDNNIQLLKSCQRNEHNTAQAAQYAAMAAQYAEANAYFSLATYLKY